MKINLEDINFYKKHLKVFLFRPWKQAYKTYSEADETRIVTNYLLRSDSHDGTFYNTYLLSVDGEIEEPVVNQLKRDAQDIELSHIRYISQSPMGFSPILNEEGVYDDFNCLPAGDGLYIITVAATKNGEKIDCPCSVLAFKGKGLMGWPVRRKTVENR